MQQAKGLKARSITRFETASPDGARFCRLQLRERHAAHGACSAARSHMSGERPGAWRIMSLSINRLRNDFLHSRGEGCLS